MDGLDKLMSNGWSYPVNGTHGILEEYAPVTYSCDTTKYAVSLDATGMGFGVLYKVSSDVWPKRAFFNDDISHIYAVISLYDSGGRSFGPVSYPIEVLFEDDNGIGIRFGGGMLNSIFMYSAFRAVDLSELVGFIIPSPGIYVSIPDVSDFFGEEGFASFELSTSYEVVKKLDMKYMPDEVATKEFMTRSHFVHPGRVMDSDPITLQLNGDVFTDYAVISEGGYETYDPDCMRQNYTFDVRIEYDGIWDEFAVTFPLTYSYTNLVYQGSKILSLRNGDCVVLFVEFGTDSNSVFKAWVKTLNL